MNSPFNEVKYKALLKGLEVSEVYFSKIDLGDRIDSEFFEKEDLEIEKILKEKDAKELRNFGDFVASAFYPAATHLYEIGDIPFIRVTDCIKYPLITKEQDASFEKIPKYFIESQSGINTLNRGDIVITKVGTPSYPSIIYEYDFVALSRTVLGLKNIHSINKYYLLIFLRSKYGFTQLQRHRELTIQYQLTLERTKRTLVYIPSHFFQKNVEKLVHKYIAGINSAKRKYTQAEEILLEELGLKDFEPSNEPVNIKSFKESFLSTGRLDAEYYQKKYEQVIEKIKSKDYDYLQNLVSIKKSIEPGSKYYSDTGIPFLRVADYDKFGLSEPDKKLSYEFVRDNQALINGLKPKKETILFSKDGSVGTAYMLRKDANFITSGAILHLTVKDKTQIIPEYLTLALNSKVVQMQAERDAGGSIILHWRVSEIENVVVPIIDHAKQQQIAELIEESFALKKQSGELLETAKRAVEIATEEDEEKAMEYIEEINL